MAKSIYNEDNAFFFMERLIRQASEPGKTIVTLRSSTWYEESMPVDVVAWIQEIGFAKWAELCSDAWTYFSDMPAGIICYEIDEKHRDCSTNCIDLGEAPKDEKPFVRIVMVEGDPRVFKLQKRQSKILPQLLQVNTRLPLGILSSNAVYDSFIAN